MDINEHPELGWAGLGHDGAAGMLIVGTHDKARADAYIDALIDKLGLSRNLRLEPSPDEFFQRFVPENWKQLIDTEPDRAFSFVGSDTPGSIPALAYYYPGG